MVSGQDRGPRFSTLIVSLDRERGRDHERSRVPREQANVRGTPVDTNLESGRPMVRNFTVKTLYMLSLSVSVQCVLVVS